MRRAAAILGLIAAVVCATTRSRAAVGRGPVRAGTVGVATVRGLPLGLQWPDGDAGSPVLEAVAADIDADGDLDVIANQGSLDLAVWFNDGSGRMTRATAVPVPGRNAFSAAPDLGDGAPATAFTVSSIAPLFEIAASTTSTPLSGSGAPTGPPSAPVRTDTRTVRSPRAPPLDLQS